MTQIIYGHVPGAMIAVSDRRLTDVRTRRVLTDDANKAVIYPGMAFHYTGLARIEGRPTDRWLCDVLAHEENALFGMRKLRDAATEAFARIALSAKDRRHAFLGVDWATARDGVTNAEPLVVLISNFASPEAWLPEARDTFELSWSLPRRNLPDGSDLHRFIDLYVAGQPLAEHRRKRLLRDLSVAAKRGAAVPAAARLLAEEIRLSGGMYRSVVGPGLLLTVLPHPALTGGVNWIWTGYLPPVNPRSVADYFKRAMVLPSAPSYLEIPHDLTKPPAAPIIPRIVDVDTSKVVFNVDHIPGVHC